MPLVEEVNGQRNTEAAQTPHQYYSWVGLISILVCLPMSQRIIKEYMSLKEYNVKKEFLSHKSERAYKIGDTYIGGDSKHTKMLLEHGFIERPKCATPIFGVVATSKLAKIEVADRNYTEGNKEHFNFEEALKIEKKLKDTGWRLPTRSEWVLICEEFGQDKKGGLQAGALKRNLGLFPAGFVYTSDLVNSGASGYYWSSTVSNATNAYSLYFGSSTINPANGVSRCLRFSVRLVRDIEAKDV